MDKKDTGCVPGGCKGKKAWIFANESGNKKRRRSSRLGQVSDDDLDSKKKIETNIKAHMWSAEKIEKKFNTNLTTGLTEEEAVQRWKTNGRNALTRHPDRSLFSIFFFNFLGWFPLMLWIAGLGACGIWVAQLYREEEFRTFDHLALGASIVGTVVLTSLYGFYQDIKNYVALKGFEKLVPVDAKVLRDGTFKFVPVESLVIGDVVEMTAGEIVPADIVILRSNQMRIDMSSITGESVPQSRDIECTSKDPLQTKNLVFFTCYIPEGNARGVVVATGRDTVIGRISDLTHQIKKEVTPLTVEIKRLVYLVTILGLGCAGGFYFLSMIIDTDWTKGFYYFIAILIANVPEGLFPALTVCLSLTAKKLYRKNCLIKKLQTVETLGAISCICMDKTGTLTENKMKVVHLAYDLKIHETVNPFEESEDDFNPLIRAACLNLRAHFVETVGTPLAAREIVGDATEKAILRYMEKKHKASELRDLHRKVCEIPFTSRSKFQLSIHYIPGLNMNLIIMKGAPEYIISHCDTIRLKGKNEKITPEINAILKEQCTTLASKGERVLGYCDWYLPKGNYPVGFVFNANNPNFPLNNYRFLGFISLLDPPRKFIDKAIKKCREAKIKMIMVSGDHPITTLAISRKVGIISKRTRTPYDDAFVAKVDPKVFMKTVDVTQYKALVVTGDELRELSKRQLDDLIQNVDELAFARITPQQKVRVVESCQRLGHVVAVTGDGVNDSPALKKADVGIAMGISGSDVSKQASDMVLLDDQFNSVVLGIEEGRLIFDNLKKCIAFTFTSNVPEMMPFILYATIGIPLPMHALSIACINVLTDLWPAIALAYERPESDLMKRPPRDLERDYLVSFNLLFMTYLQISLIQVVAAMTGYFICFALHGFLPLSLLFTRTLWNRRVQTDLEDSFGQEWNYEERKYVENIAQTTYYANLIVVQVADMLICKTRRLSLLQQGMMNIWLNFAIAFAIGMGIATVYVPFFNYYLKTYPIPIMYWLPGVPFAGLIIILDEFRRLIIRKCPGGWFERDLYW